MNRVCRLDLPIIDQRLRALASLCSISSISIFFVLFFFCTHANARKAYGENPYAISGSGQASEPFLYALHLGFSGGYSTFSLSGDEGVASYRGPSYDLGFDYSFGTTAISFAPFAAIRWLDLENVQNSATLAEAIKGNQYRAGFIVRGKIFFFRTAYTYSTIENSFVGSSNSVLNANATGLEVGLGVEWKVSSYTRLTLGADAGITRFRARSGGYASMQNFVGTVGYLSLKFLIPSAPPPRVDAKDQNKNGQRRY